MDDSFTLDEIEPNVHLEAFNVLVNGTEDKEPLTAKSAGQLARNLASEFVGNGVDDYKTFSLGGCDLYDVDKVIKAAKKKALECLEDALSKGEAELAKDAKDALFTVDTHAARGRRPKMEDRHVVIEDFNAFMGLEGFPIQSFYAVYDGHGGQEAAHFCRAQLHRHVASQDTFQNDLQQAMIDGFLSTDKAFLKKAEREGLASGATVCAVLIRGKKLSVAWLGDSQAQLCKGGEAIQLMDPHKPQREDEKKRIEDLGGVVVWYGAWRVNGVLSVARAIGDAKLKQYVIGRPDVAEVDLTDDTDFLIVACDGLWDVMDMDKVIEFVNKYREDHDNDTKGIAKSITAHCIDELGSSDNLTVLFVFFSDLSSDAWTSS